MTRTLPWLKAAAATKAKPDSSSPSATTPARQPPVKRRRVATPPPDSDNELDLNTTGLATPSRRRLLRGDRTPSTSPPPAPPEEMRMREGLAADDIWWMVEDEFYSTAQAYTVHLHRAEYDRLKKLAAEREKVIKTHGTDGKSKMSADGQRALRDKREKSVTEAIKKCVIAGADEAESEGDDPWVGTQLAGLMDSPRKAQKLRAKRMGVGRSETRAARGFGRSELREGRRVSFDEEAKPVSPTRARHDWQKVRGEQETNDMTDDADDLDAPARTNVRSRDEKSLPATSRLTDRHPPSWISQQAQKSDSHRQPQGLSPPRPGRAVTSTTTSTRREKHTEHSPPRSILRKQERRETTTTRTPHHSTSKSSLTRTEDTDDFGFPTTTQPSQSAGGGFLARRRAERDRERLQKENEEKKKRRGSIGASAEVPTFLF